MPIFPGITVDLTTNGVPVVGSGNVTDWGLDVLSTAKDCLGETCIVDCCDAEPDTRRFPLEVLPVGSLYVDRVLGAKVRLEEWVDRHGCAEYQSLVWHQAQVFTESIFHTPPPDKAHM